MSRTAAILVSLIVLSLGFMTNGVE